MKRAVPRSKISGSVKTASAAPSHAHGQKGSASAPPKPANTRGTSAGSAASVESAPATFATHSHSTQKPPAPPSKGTLSTSPALAPQASPAPPATRKANVATASYAAALKAGAGPSPLSSKSPVGTSLEGAGGRGTLSSPLQGSASSEYDAASGSPQQSHLLPLPQPALLQHQEQFPLPSSQTGERAGIANVRLRAHSESFLNMAQKSNTATHTTPHALALPQQQQQQQQQQHSPGRPPHVSFLSSDDNGHLPPTQPMQQQQQQSAPFFDGFGLPFQHQHQYQPQSGRQAQGHDSSFGLLGGPSSGISASSMSWNPDHVYRSDIERSTSLGGLGWMPSSIASSPPENRRGVSDLGLGQMPFGMGQSHPSIPSPAAWVSMVDLGGGQYDQQSSQSQGGVPFGSPDISNGRNSGYGGSSSNEYDFGSDRQRLGSASLGNDDDDDTYLLSDLRLQASEFVPSSANMSAWGGGGGSR